MGIKFHKPTSPGRRGMSGFVFEEITTSTPEKSLLAPLKKKGGRNNNGRITVRHRGGGHKRRYRVVDFKREKLGIPAKVSSIEYDPNRSARLALLVYKDGEKRYILAPDGLKVGEILLSGPDSAIQIGNALPISKIPMGTLCHNIEMKPGAGGKIARSAGASAQLMAKEDGYAQFRLSSGEIRMVSLSCSATIGEVGNSEHSNISLGKAGRKRWLGKKPHVRGVAMNPVDHPLGGGEGKSSGGRHPVTPWGKPTKGYKTRNVNKSSSKFIVRRRKVK